MSQIRVNNITNRTGIAGPTVAGIASVSSSSHFVVPTGRTGQRYVDEGENIVREGLVLYLDAKYSYPGTNGIGITATNPDVYTWYDMSGNGNDGELINGVSYNSSNSGSLYFDEVNNVVVVPYSPTYSQNGSMSVEMWAKVGSQLGADQDTGSGRFLQLITNRNTSDNDTTFQLFIDNRALIRTFNPTGNDRMVLGYSIGNGTVQFYTFSKEKFGNTSNFDLQGDNQWHQVIGITDNDRKMIYLYYDGQLVHSNSFSGTPATPSTPLRIGSSYSWTNNAPVNDYPFSGNIAITRIYNKALTSAEVLQNYNALKGRFGL